MRCFAPLTLCFAACVPPSPSPSFSFDGPPFGGSGTATVIAATSAENRVTLGLDDDQTADARLMTLEHDIIGDDGVALPAIDDVLTIIGSVSEFEELPEATYWRLLDDAGTFVVEGGLIVRNGDDSPVTGEDIDAVVSLADGAFGEVHGVAQGDDATIDLAPGESTVIERDGVRTRVIVIEAGRSLNAFVRGYAYPIAD